MTSKLARRLARKAQPESSPLASLEERSARLDALRKKLQRAVGKTSTARHASLHRQAQTSPTNARRAAGPKPVAERGPKLPFDTIATQDGELHVRTVYTTPAQCMGTVGLSGAMRADPGMLSLVALSPELAGCSLKDAVFLDAETTGLGNGTGNYPFLMGVCFMRDGGWVLNQYLLRDPADEPALLARMYDHIHHASLIASFNGKSFDVPLLRSRFVMNRMRAPEEPPHLDLLHVARRIHRTRTFRKSLTTLEREVLGFHRGPNDVAGAEVAERYLHYLHSRDESELADVVEHNELDVLTLVALTALYGEPLAMLEAEELASVADVMRRAGDLEQACSFADVAVRRGATEAGLRSRALINKARGDRARALVDFERLSRQVDDADVRLELAKLYEHYVRDHERALAFTLDGTGEKPADQARRRARLERKLERARPDEEDNSHQAVLAS